MTLEYEMGLLIILLAVILFVLVKASAKLGRIASASEESLRITLLLQAVSDGDALAQAELDLIAARRRLENKQ